ncbi:hypothetical protein INT47_002190 [Mucor saturninus]|uniref:RRM domain-containing protein n=1 Tax=Mucor saturninus TaxID=64648 RepID=A0A8H7R8L1_9FUNG|nr:hypothetical protein INT47_002190 [Mucor saturninus]
MGLSDSIQSIWSNIPNVQSVPSFPSAPCYGDHQVTNYGRNPFRMNELTTTLPVSFEAFDPFNPLTVPLGDYGQDKNDLENSKYIGENFGYSLFGNTSNHAFSSSPLQKISVNGNRSNLQNPQLFNRRLSCASPQKITTNQPFNCVIQNQSQNTPSERALSWSQVVALTSESSEKLVTDDKSTMSTSLDVTADIVLFNPDAEGRTSRKYISESAVLTQGDNRLFSPTPVLPSYMVIKVLNVPWCTSSEELNKFIEKSSYFSVPSIMELPHNVHVIMDRQTGKTYGIAFIEVKPKANVNINQESMNTLSRYPLQGRRLKFTISSYDELRQRLFSTWTGSFRNGVAIPFPEKQQGLKMIADKDQDVEMIGDKNTAVSSGSSDFFIGQRDLQSILQISRNYKVFYNRKCPERSFEYIMSIVMQMPWLQTRAVSTCQRDIMYECYKLATDYLKMHTSKPLHSFHSTLVPRFIRAAMVCNGFTVRQKLNILKTA